MQLVDELLVECVYKDEGCQARMQRQCLALHLKEECKYSELRKLGSEILKEKPDLEEKGKTRQVSDEDEVATVRALC
ncbi:hypothetical protein NMY22_g6532 [Coprinellus aureogranulatus]|nr:hypothetical protein NMY22_g6532 [Coprinellus aureogranulatus]